MGVLSVYDLFLYIACSCGLGLTLGCKTAFTDLPALRIVVDSPQPDAGGARTWNGKTDPLGERPNNFFYSAQVLIFLSI